MQAQGEQRLDGRVVELDVADGQNRFAGAVQQSIGVGQRRSDRLLHQEMQASRKQVDAHFGMQDRRHGEHDCRALLAQLIQSRAGSHVVLLGDALGDDGVAVEDSDELYVRETSQDADVVLPERARADDTDAQVARTAFRQRRPRVAGRYLAGS